MVVKYYPIDKEKLDLAKLEGIIETTKLEVCNLKGLKVEHLRSIIKEICNKDLSEDDKSMIENFLIDLMKFSVREGKDLSEKMNSKEFLFGFLPYFFIGFGFLKNREESYNGLNNFQDGFEVIRRFLANEKLIISSVLCAHKDKTEVSLINSLERKYIRNAVNLIKGLVKNTPIKNAEMVFIQPSGSVFSTIFLYPALIKNYLKKDLIGEMIDTLDNHIKDFKQILLQENEPGILFSVDSINIFEQYIEDRGKIEFGNDWKQMSSAKIYSLAGADFEPSKNKLAEIAYYMALKDMERLGLQFDYQKDLEEINSAKQNPLKDEAKEIIENLRKFSLYGKAICDCLFYCAWGDYVRKLNGAAICFEIDHEIFQTLCFKIGYSGRETNLPSPIIYSRKSRKDERDNNLKGICFRESWR